VLEEVYLKDSPEVQRLVQDICGGFIDVIVFLTGVGTRALVETAASMGCKDEFIRCLDQQTVIARSPKPARVLRQHQVHIDVMPPEPYTSEALVQAIAGIPLEGKQVAVQAYGAPNGYLTQSLEGRGARVREVTLYTWGLPEDPAPALRMIDQLAQGKIGAVAFTSQPQVGNLCTIAARAGQRESLLQGLNEPSVVVGSVGPVCTRRLREAGIKVDVEPEHPHMGNLILALAQHFSPGCSPPR
jgi:uroporphyrinogen-III synthase